MSMDALSAQLALLPDYLGNHLLLSVLALLLGIGFCLPLAVVITRVKSLQWPTLAFAGVMQTVPGIALLALMVPLLGQIGFLPALIALFLYSMLPVLRNTVTGILEVDPVLLEAADGIGMTDMQRLFQVELPTAAPVIIAGIRTSTVWVIGTATLSTPVGATSLGNYIFSGLQTQNQTAVLVGCVAAALLAIVLDQLIHTFELAYRKRSRPLGLIAGAILVVFIFAGTYPALSEKASAAATQEENIIVGAKPFTEQYILADLISELLTENDIPVENRSSLGSTVLFNALRDNLVDCYVDYTGTIWANVMKRDDIRPPAEVLDEMNVWLKDTYGIVDLGPLGFENTYALAIKRSLADSLNIRSIADLSLYAPNLRIGSDYEFFSRPEWKALEKNYGLGFAREISLDPSLMYEAIDQGQVDVISAYSTDGRIVDYDLAVLTDPSHVLPPYDAVLLLSPEAAENIAITGTLGRLIGSISDREMRLANKLVDVDGLPVDSAAAFLRNLVD